MEKKISVGVKISGIASIILGLFYIFLFLLKHKDKDAVFLLPLVLFIVSGIGILFFHNWGRRLMLVLSGYCLIISTFVIYILVGLSYYYETGLTVSFWKQIITKILPICGISNIPAIAFLYFLTRPRVKEQFK